MEHLSSLSDEAIIHLLHSRSEQAIRPLLARYGDALYGIMYRMVQSRETAEDLMQEVFVKVWKNGPSYDPSKGKLFTWLLNITRNTAIDHLRLVKNQKQRQSISLDRLVYHPTTNAKVKEVGLQHALEKLDEKYHQVIELLYLRGYSQREAAEVLNIPLGTVKTRALTAVRELRKMLREYPFVWWGGVFLFVLTQFMKQIG